MLLHLEMFLLNNDGEASGPKRCKSEEEAAVCSAQAGQEEETVEPAAHSFIQKTNLQS